MPQIEPAQTQSQFNASTSNYQESRQEEKNVMDMIVKSPGDKDHLLHPVLKTQSRFNQTQYLNKGASDAMKLDLNSKHYAEQKEALDRVTPRILN